LYRARARHNLGYLAFLGGDLPSALAEMDAAHTETLALAREGDPPGPHPVYHLDRARVLFSAGLLAESDAELEEAVSGFAELGSRQDRAECELSRAQIALSRDRPAEAVAFAGRARRRFARRGSSAWAQVAQLVVLRAGYELGRSPRRIAVEAEALARSLAADGLAEDARMARLLAVRAEIAADGRGRHGSPAGHPGWRAVPLHRDDGILTRLYARQVRAEAADAQGRPDLAARELRAGLRELHRHQSSFGSLDLQTAVPRHAAALAARGLQAAITAGRPAQVLAWSEQARALASRLPPVRPPADPEAAELLEQLRFVRTELRSVELAGHEDPHLRARRVDLERRIRQRAWYQSGAGDVAEPVRAAEVSRALTGAPGGGRDGALVAHLLSAGRLHALLLRPAGGRLIDLGPADGLWEALRRVRADLDVLALRGIPAPMRRTVRGSLGHGLERLSARLWEPVSRAAGPGPVVLVPPGALTAVPWGMLPGLRGRPLTVSRSATTWWRSMPEQRSGAGSAGAGSAGAGSERSGGDALRVLLAAGPDLVGADQEVRQAAAGWPGSTVLTGDDATGQAVLAAMSDADVVHLAAHGVHEAANPLFSAVQLADGPLFGYDLSRLARLPDQVVLSACDLGLATERPGDELLGMTAALLHGGTRCVVAAVARVSDEVAREVTVAYHRGLRAGLGPSRALATATGDREDAPFVCFGNGW
jgi:hypothetical protein